jgi:hypothetical protein
LARSSQYLPFEKRIGIGKGEGEGEGEGEAKAKGIRMG